jgi:hypothetical protein
MSFKTQLILFMILNFALSGFHLYKTITDKDWLESKSEFARIFNFLVLVTFTFVLGLLSLIYLVVNSK